MIKFPFTTLQQFNLDWIMQQLRKILDFMPLNGSAGDVLQRTADGAAWQPIAAISIDIHSLQPIGDDVAGNDELAIYDNSAQGNYKATVTEIMEQAPVQSVNGQTGDVVLTNAVDSVNGQTGTVVLDAADVGALPDTTVIPDDTSDLTNGAGFVDAAGAAAAAPVQSVNGMTGAVIISGGGAVDSVNGQTGTVVLDADDVGALPDTYTAPVTSVNGMTGDVIVSGGGGSLATDLLWTNSSPNSNFIAQMVSLDLSTYKMVLIETSYDVDASYFHLFTIPTSRLYNIMTGITPAGKFERRFIVISSTGIDFNVGQIMDTYAGTYTNDNFWAKPYKIYGIK